MKAHIVAVLDEEQGVLLNEGKSVRIRSILLSEFSIISKQKDEPVDVTQYGRNSSRFQISLTQSTAIFHRPPKGTYFCPSCQRDTDTVPSLSTRENSFFCTKCHITGDWLSLINLSRAEYSERYYCAFGDSLFGEDLWLEVPFRSTREEDYDRFWLFHNCLVITMGIFQSDEERSLIVKEVVWKREKRFARLLKLAEVDKSIQRASRREIIPEDVRMFVWQRDQGRCVQCTSKENLEFDHIIPVSKGGANTARNIQLLCERCNRTKKDTI